MSTTPVVIQTQKQTQVMMKIIILLNALSWAASFQIGGGELGAVVPRRRWISTMFYANSQDDGQNAPRSLFSSPVQSTHSNNQAKKRGDSDEEAVDEYLAFLAKRYRRMHEDDEVAAAFNGWKWLGMGGDKNDAGLTQSQQEENALYALGVAGLASKKLLQKHRVSSERVGAVAERCAPVGSTLVVNDVAKAADEEATKQSHTKIVHCAYEVVHSVSKARRTLHECQSHQLRAAAQVAVRAPITMGRKLFQLGGGQKTVSLTAAVALALVFVLIKPAVHFVASESVNMTRGA